MMDQRTAKAVPLEPIPDARPDPRRYAVPGKHAAAAKRASLDLTRALADLRRSGT